MGHFAKPDLAGPDLADSDFADTDLVDTDHADADLADSDLSKSETSHPTSNVTNKSKSQITITQQTQHPKHELEHESESNCGINIPKPKSILKTLKKQQQQSSSPKQQQQRHSCKLSFGERLLTQDMPPAQPASDMASNLWISGTVVLFCCFFVCFYVRDRTLLSKKGGD